MDNQEQQRKYGRCPGCEQIDKYGKVCDYWSCKRDETRRRYNDPIDSIYPHDLVGLNITTMSSQSSRGNCMGCYRQGIMNYSHRDCNQRIAYLETAQGHVMDACFLATYYRQFTNEPRDIESSRLKPIRGIPDTEYISSTAATRGRNALVPQDQPYVESDESMQDEQEESGVPSDNEIEDENADDVSIEENIQGDENSPNGENSQQAHPNNNEDSDSESDDWQNERPSYHDQPEPPVGSDEYILELIVDVVDPSNLNTINGEEIVPDEDSPPLTPLEQRVFNEQMYIRLREMAEGNIGYYDGMFFHDVDL